MKTTLAFLGGLIIGGVAGAYFMHKKEQTAIDLEYQDLREAKRKHEDAEEEAKESKRKSDESFKQSEEDKKKMYSYMNSSEYKDILKEQGYDVHKKKDEERKNDNMKEPYIMTEQEYNDSEFECVTVSLYEDGTFVDSDGHPMDSEQYDEVIGVSVHEIDDTMGDDEDCIYIHNEQLGLDIELIKVCGEYEE